LPSDSGFAFGGLAVYGFLISQPYCDKCSRYLSGKGKRIRYTGNRDGLQASAKLVLADLQNGAMETAIDQQKAFG